MCQETTDPKTESTTSTGDVLVKEDCEGGIIIRRYESSDDEQVKYLFRSGMESLIPAAYTAVVKNPFVALTLTSLAALAAGIAINRSMMAAGKRVPL
jgi:hypothetical protein